MHRVLVGVPIIVSVELSLPRCVVIKAMYPTHGSTTFFELAEVFLSMLDSVMLLFGDGANETAQRLIHSSDVRSGALVLESY